MKQNGEPAEDRLFPVIMSGGAGSRLWPLSRRALPKQFVRVAGQPSLLEQTANRLTLGSERLALAPVSVICGAGQSSFVLSHLAASGMIPDRVIVEPESRNTAMVAALAALSVERAAPGSLVLLMPADHHMSRPEGFWDAVCAGISAAKDGRMIVFGIDPAGPHTGYGYIRRGVRISDGVHEVAQFREKPDRQSAEAFVLSGEYFWNSGIFLFRSDVLIDAFREHAPEVLEGARRAVDSAVGDGPVTILKGEAYEGVPSQSLDVAVIEKAPNMAVVPSVSAGWSDIGSWSSFCEHYPVSTGTDRMMLMESVGCVGISDGPLITGIGLTDLVIVADRDVVLILPKGRDQDVRTLVSAIGESRYRDRL